MNMKKNYVHSLFLNLIPLTFLHKFINPYKIAIDVDGLIGNLYISPFAKDTYFSCIKSICSKYEINHDKIIVSKLLSGEDDLLYIFSR
jgi:hypothetical protein